MIDIMSALQSIFDQAQELTLQTGTALFRRNDPVRSMFFNRTGAINLERPLADGTALTLHTAVEGMLIAEASLFADAYHCDAVATVPTVVARLPRERFIKLLAEMPEASLSIIKAQASEVQSQRARIEILRLRRVAERLNAWLELNGVPIKGEWKRIADEIGVSPPALYREIARRKRV